MGVDSSTNSFAYSIFEGDKLVEWGEVNYKGTDFLKRLKYATSVLHASMTREVDLVLIESSVKVGGISTLIKMAYFNGMVLGVVGKGKADLFEVVPTAWQSFIGNKNFTTAEKAALKTQFPGRSAIWYKNKIRELRKDRTRQWVKNTFGRDIESDNITDAIGVGWYGVKEYGPTSK